MNKRIFQEEKRFQSLKSNVFNEKLVFFEILNEKFLMMWNIETFREDSIAKLLEITNDSCKMQGKSKEISINPEKLACLTLLIN